jgi:hypothetical protein
MDTNNRERVENKERNGWRGRKEKRIGNIHKHYATKAVSVTAKQCLGEGKMQHKDCL